MTRDTENRIQNFKTDYMGFINESPDNKTSEAGAIGVEPQTISSWTNPNLPQCNLSAALVPLSLHRDKILLKLCKESGGEYLKFGEEFFGTTEDLKKLALQILADMQIPSESGDAKGWTALIRLGQKALKDSTKQKGKKK